MHADSTTFSCFQRPLGYGLHNTCNLSVKDKQGSTPLHYVVCKSRYIGFLVTILQSVLHYAAKNDSCERVQCLIEEHKLDEDEEGYTGLVRVAMLRLLTIYYIRCKV